MIQLKEQEVPALIDTGSSGIVVPEKHFDFLKYEWDKALNKNKLAFLDCGSDENFCEIKTSCDRVVKFMKPVSFLISGNVFELPPEQYLF